MSRLIGLYVVIDDIAESVVGSMLVFHNDVLAVRFMQDLVRDPQSALQKHPSDVRMLAIGMMDQTSGTIVEAFKKPRVVITGAKAALVGVELGVKSPAPVGPQLERKLRRRR